MSSRNGFTQTLYAMTTRIFRCRGLAMSSPEHDRFGGLDAACVIVFCALAAGWYFFVFEPQRLRNQMLQGRQEVLQAQLRSEAIELRRLRREMAQLERKDPAAWERAARGKLGWLKPGEIIDVVAWRKESVAAGRGDPAPPPRPAQRTPVRRVAVQRAPAPRHALPPVPVGPPRMPAAGPVAPPPRAGNPDVATANAVRTR